MSNSNPQPTTPDAPATSIELALASMLTENTGRHFLDSGSAYGRDWQRNRELVDGSDPVTVFRNRPAITVDDWGSPTLDVFHYLRERLEPLTLPDPDDKDPHPGEILAAEWEAMSESEDNDPLWAPSAAEEWLKDHGATVSYVVNTYNHETMLSQILQYVQFTLDGETYVALQIHGGCDARGGYTAAQLFTVTLYDYDMFGVDVADCDISLEVPNVNRGQLTTDGHCLDHDSWHETGSIRSYSAECSGDIHPYNLREYYGDPQLDNILERWFNYNTPDPLEDGWTRTGPASFTRADGATISFHEPYAD